jgi:FkbM family methyltransferase
MLLDLDKLKEKYDLKIKGVIHIGAHFGEEYTLYEKLNISNTIFFEPVPETFATLKSNIGDKTTLVNTALGNMVGEIEMNIENTNQGQSSSILEPVLHLQQYPHIKFNNKTKVTITKLDTFIEDKDKYNMINIDVQGYELEVFKGGKDYLNHIDYIITEVNREELYKGCARIEELDKYLSDYGFDRVETTWDGITWGDALYIKNNDIKMVINKKKIFEQNLDYYDNDLESVPPYIKGEKEHYKLLTYITKLYNNITLIDAGTFAGHSCLALAQNKTNKVITYDIEEKDFPFFKKYKNIEFKKLDINKESPSLIKSADIICLDIDPHDGKQEKIFIDYLIKIGYKGYVICDDIHLNKEMQGWWDSVPIEKHDITEVGHFSGTGLINFNKKENFKYE